MTILTLQIKYIFKYDCRDLLTLLLLLLFMTWQMQTCMDVWFSCVLNHICTWRAHAWHSRRVSWGKLSPHACAACSAVSKPQMPPPSSSSRFLFIFFSTLATAPTLLHSRVSPLCTAFLLPFSSPPSPVQSWPTVHVLSCLSAAPQSCPALSFASLAWT